MTEESAAAVPRSWVAARAPWSALLALGSIAPAGVALEGQEPPGVDFTQTTRAVVELSDVEMIDFLLFELFLDPEEPASRLQVIDVTRNGFGPDDVVVALPSSEVFLIPAFVPDTVQRVMSGWHPEAEYRMDAGNMPIDALAGLIGSDPDRARQAESAILYDVVQAVERSYEDIPVAILFARDSLGFTFQLWDYNQEAMRYAYRPAFVTDSAVASVVSLLEEVGYVPGQNRAGLGVSLEAQGTPVASVESVLRTVARVPDDDARTLAIRTVLLGSYDTDRSGMIDRAREIDALPCSLWGSMRDVFPGFPEAYGFGDPQTRYVGNVLLSIAARVREPATRRITSCLSGEEPQPTDPAEVAAAAVAEPAEPDAVSDFEATNTAVEIVRQVGVAAPESSDWAQGIRGVLLDRYDADASGLLDRSEELASIPCEVWQAVAATRGEAEGGPAIRSLGALADAIGLAPSQHSRAESDLVSCLAELGPTTSVRLRAPRATRTGLPPDEIRSAVTIPLTGLARVPDEEGRLLPAKTVLLAMFDLDRSGFVDQPPELDAIPCEVWSALDIAFPDFALRYGFVNPTARRPYRGGLLLNIDEALRAPAERRILACQSGREPPSTAPMPELEPGRRISVPVSLRDFLDLQIAAELVRSATRSRGASAAWAASVQAILLESYDLDGSGTLDREDEIVEVPCVVWSAVEATYGTALTDLGFDGSGTYLGDRIGIDRVQGAIVLSRLETCGG